MKPIAIIAAALISTGAVSAESISPGHARAAAALNLDATQYTLAELISIEVARSENDTHTERYFLTGTNRVSRGGVGEVSPGKARIAAALGVNAADYSLSELTALDVARSENETHTEAFILSRQGGVSRGGAGEVSPGKARIAAELGVNAADYSLNELVALSAARLGDDD
ncbi:hypothetical protein [Roseinatronobacter sp. S2]|uniref:hypothetical protein n=1 Tax=Roseinatronobacter sp. S2 TaxID=3035471 RepID=UPI00240F268E|nr:hypothetical protein [Roseinatronobacter sp. S2]WFE76535.1 hypothetical protein P8S53_18615 [Roseinatronobacter sp. S2]